LNAAELEYGRHKLKVFETPRFAHLALKSAPEERRTHWIVFHEGRPIAVRKNEAGGKLIHVLRDPAHKGNLLAVRKDNLARPLGETRIFTVSPAGEESPIAAATLVRAHPARDLAEIYSLAVRPYSLSKKVAQRNRERELRKKLAKLTKKHALEGQPTTGSKTWEKIVAARDELNTVTEIVVIAPEKAITPPGRRVYSYRMRGLCLLLVKLQEELAESAGFSGVQALLNKNTTAAFLPRYGWKKLTEGGYYEKKFKH